MSALRKLGVVTSLGPEPVMPTTWDPGTATEEPWAHGNTYERSTAGGVPVLIIGAASGHVELLRSLLDVQREPFWILYVLTVPRSLGDAAKGRYASDQPMARAGVEAMLEDYGDFLEKDARHQVWFAPDAERSSPLVYDQRNRIFAYGPVERYAAICDAAGLVEGPVVIPSGLARHYHPEFDADEERLVKASHLAWTWNKHPLRPMDED